MGLASKQETEWKREAILALIEEGKRAIRTSNIFEANKVYARIVQIYVSMSDEEKKESLGAVTAYGDEVEGLISAIEERASELVKRELAGIHKHKPRIKDERLRKKIEELEAYARHLEEKDAAKASSENSKAPPQEGKQQNPKPQQAKAQPAKQAAMAPGNYSIESMMHGTAKPGAFGQQGFKESSFKRNKA